MRERIMVAALVPAPTSIEIDGLRRAVGDRRRTAIVPHVTLVPPVNLTSEVAADAVDHCRVVASRHRPLKVVIGAPDTFAPVNPVVYLSVESSEELLALRNELHDGPLARLDLRAFVPHVTLNARCALERIDHTLAAAVDYRAEVVVSAVHVLESIDGLWTVRETCPLAAPEVVGRGGLPIELTSTVDHGRCRVVARHDGEQVGEALAELRGDRCVLWTVGHHDDVGDVGRHLISSLCSLAARHGVDEVVAIDDGATLAALLERCGFGLDGGVWSRTT